MTYLQQRLQSVQRAFPDVPLEALKAAMIEGVEAFAWYKDGVQYCGTTGTKRKGAIAEILMAGGQPMSNSRGGGSR